MMLLGKSRAIKNIRQYNTLISALKLTRLSAVFNVQNQGSQHRHVIISLITTVHNLWFYAHGSTMFYVAH